MLQYHGVFGFASYTHRHRSCAILGAGRRCGQHIHIGTEISGKLTGLLRVVGFNISPGGQ